jgi:hypothetical protein
LAPQDPGPYHLPVEPAHVLDGEDAPLPGHYEARFVTDDGREVRRYLTDKGRTAVLRVLASGTDRFAEEDLEAMTVEPDLDALVERMAAESGEGA